jgi:transporter family protein
MRPWLLWTVGAVVSWGVWALLGKLVGDTLSPALTQALSTIGILPVLLLMAFSLKLSHRNQDQTQNLLDKSCERKRLRGAVFAFGAGMLTCLGNVAYYEVLNHGAKAATVVPLTALYPVVTILLAMLFLKERLNHIQFAGLALSLCAIYLFNVQQEQGFLSSWLLVALIPIALWGIAGLLQKVATNHISGELSTVWFLAAFVPVAVYILLRSPLPSEITSGKWLLVIALGFTFALGNFALLAAFASHGKASIIAPLAALYPVVSIPIAILLLHERVGWRETVGIAFALISAVALSWETRAPSEAAIPT